MDTSQLIDVTREGLRMALMLGGPVLVVALVVGLVVGAGQTVTQMHDPVVALVPRMAAVAIAVLLLLDWLVGSWISYASDLIGSIPQWL
jgi:flagellar biosynthetic protein FliQ